MNNTKHSNCLLEALKAKIRSCGKAEIHQIGKWSWIWKKRCFPHFYWTLGGKKFKFNVRYTDEPLYGQLWYEGVDFVMRSYVDEEKVTYEFQLHGFIDDREDAD